jgi:CHAT domain-containing protein
MSKTKLSISSLVKNDENIGNVSVRNIKNFKKRNNISVEVKEIIDIKQQQNKKKMKAYNFFYKKCIETIKISCNSNKNELIFEVPKHSNIDMNYNYIECLTYIKQKLEANKFYITSKDNLIFISWKYIDIK